MSRQRNSFILLVVNLHSDKAGKNGIWLDGGVRFLDTDSRLSPLSEVFDLSSALHFSARLF